MKRLILASLLTLTFAPLTSHAECLARGRAAFDANCYGHKTKEICLSARPESCVWHEEENESNPKKEQDLDTAALQAD